MINVLVSAVGVGRFGKREEPLVDLLTEAARLVLESIGRKTVDLLIVGSMLSSFEAIENLVSRVADRLGLETAAGYRVEAASATGAAAFHAAVSAIRSGLARRVLVVAGEKMTGHSTGQVMRALAQSLAPAEEELGATMAGLAALVAQRYLRRYHLDDRAFDPVSVLDRAASARNPQAQFRTPVSLAEVARSRPVALPLRLFHCSAITDGAAAVVLEKGSGGVQVLGFGQGMDNQPLVDRAELTTFRATRSAAQRAYEMAKMTRKELSFAELHDAFAPFGLIDLEDIGICGPGGAAGWFSKEWTGVNGRFPVNPSGGLLGRGHPVGATGLVQIAEIARQLGDDAGPLQLPGRPSVGLAQSIGGMGCHNFVTILGRGRDP